jgi:hypothetical protein
MHARGMIRRLPLTALVASAAVAASTLGAQTPPPTPPPAKPKILTPPKPADTTKRTPASSAPAPNAQPGLNPAGPTAARPAVVVPQSPVLDSIREIVFHNLLEKDRAGFSTLASAFCLGLSNDDFKKAPASQDRADPVEGMVRRLATPRTPARRASTCTFTPNAPGRSIAGRALLYTVGAIDLSAGDRGEAAAGYNYDGYSWGGYTFSVERSDSGWVVKQWRMEFTARASSP